MNAYGNFLLVYQRFLIYLYFLLIRFAQVDAITYDILAVITSREEQTTK